MKEGLSLFCVLFHSSTQKSSGHIIGTHKDVLNKKRNEAMAFATQYLWNTLGELSALSVLPLQEGKSGT